MTSGIFISYRRDDDPSSAARIRDALAQRFGDCNVFMDIDSVKAGQRFEEELNKAIGRSQVLIAIIGQRWLSELHARARGGQQDYVRVEIATALRRKLPVVPVRVGGVSKILPLPAQGQLPDDIRDLVRYQAHDVTHEHFARDVASLAKDIQGLVPHSRRFKVSWKMAAVLVAVGLLAAYKIVEANWPHQPTVLLRTGRLFDVAKQQCDHAREFMKSNADLIKAVSCEQVTSCPTMQSWVNTCDAGIDLAAAEYRNRIEYAFAFHLECQGIRFLQDYYSPGRDAIKVNTKEVLGVISDKPHWSLIVDYNPGDQETTWDLNRFPDFKSISSEKMDPKGIAAAVCTIIKNQMGSSKYVAQ